MKPATLSTGFAADIIALFTADVVFTQAHLPDKQDESGTTADSQPVITGVTTATSASPDVLNILVSNKFNFSETGKEESLLSMIIQDGTPAKSLVLTLEGDRAGFISWVESPRVKLYFMSLKEALHSSFTPHVKDLVDEIQRSPGKPEMHFLTFNDTGISPERLVFIRIRDRLYEFHIAGGKDTVIFDLIEKLIQ